MPKHRIVCRALLAEDCFDGEPSAVQFDYDAAISEDGTFECGDKPPGSIVCDPCYLLLLPFTPSGQGLNEELPAAIEHLRASLLFLQSHPNPSELVAEAQAAAANSRINTPRQRSAAAMQRLAEAEVARRANRTEQKGSPMAHYINEVNLTEGERFTLVQALDDYVEGVEKNCEDQDLKAQILGQVESTAHKLGVDGSMVSLREES